MSPDFVIGFGRQAIELCLMMALPMLAVGLGVGVLVSVIQAATQIQEMTLTFIPKIVCMFLALLVPQCVSRRHVLVALFTTVLSISLKVAGMTQWNIAVATVLGASLGTWLLLRKAQQEGAPCDFAGETRTPACKCTEEAES